MLFAFTVAKHVKSNAIVYAKDGATLGIGAGQMNRGDSARIAALRAAELRAGTSKGSAAGVGSLLSVSRRPDAGGRRRRTAVIQPGGSIGDQKVIDAADEAAWPWCSPACGCSGTEAEPRRHPAKPNWPRSSSSAWITRDLTSISRTRSPTRM